MGRKLWPPLKRLGGGLVILSLLVLLLPRAITELAARPQTFAAPAVPPQPIAIVFGAGLTRAALPTPALADRLTAAAQLYLTGKVPQLLLSGDQNGGYSEPAAMQAYLEKLGVPPTAIVLDGDGDDTYATCARAAQVFGIQAAILVTTDFHLPRALYLCNAFGIASVGVPTGWGRNGSAPRGLGYAWGVMREFPATTVEFWELYVVAR